LGGDAVPTVLMMSLVAEQVFVSLRFVSDLVREPTWQKTINL
jgi:hypothetical protein